MKELKDLRAFEAPFSELERRISNHKKQFRFSRIFGRLKHEPIIKETIDKLIMEGWQIREGDDSRLDTKRKIIYLEKGISDYERDVALFHEISHIPYGNDLYDAFASLRIGFDAERNEITEWLARQLRADPELLKHTILAFGLEPRIYDKISFLAFHPEAEKVSLSEKQLAFPFAQDYWNKMNHVEMGSQC